MFKNVLVATDGSKSALNAVNLAATLAATIGAELTVAHVLIHGPVPASLVKLAKVEHLISPQVAGIGNSSAAVGEVFRADQSEVMNDEIHRVIGQQIVDSASAQAKLKGVGNVKTMVRNGPVVKEILQAAKESDAELIVIGTRGLSDIKELLMGGVSHKVCQLTKLPCLTVH